MNCKPGDLAIVIRGLTHPSPNVGRVVEIVSKFADHESLGVCWYCKSRKPVKVRTSRGDVLVTEFWAPDAWLRPVSGLPMRDEQLDEVPA